MGTLWRDGNQVQKARWLPLIAAGQLRLQAFGVTEPTSGSDTLNLRTTAVREGDHYIINGQKIWTSRAEHSDLLLLIARTMPREAAKTRTEGLSVFLVDMRLAQGTGISLNPIRTMMNHATTELFFDDLRVPPENLVGEEGMGFRYILSGMNAERILIAAECIGDCKWFIEKASAYAKQRSVFGRPIGQNQGIQFPIARAYAQMRAAELMVHDAASLYEHGYDKLARGESAYFVWLNRGKESVVLDLAKDDDKALLDRMLAKADVFIQNLKPGAVGKLGFAIERLRRDYPKLICCSISGFGESGPFAKRKSYDLLVQAESGLASVTGGPEAPARVGVSVTDVAAGMNAYEAVLEAIIARGRTGQGAAVSVSLFDAMADWMTVPLLHHEGGQSPKRLGLAHPSIAPYGVFNSKDDVPILISIQNDREWRILAAEVMDDTALASDPQFGKLVDRVKHRAETDGKVAA